MNIKQYIQVVMVLMLSATTCASSVLPDNNVNESILPDLITTIPAATATCIDPPNILPSIRITTHPQYNVGYPSDPSTISNFAPFGVLRGTISGTPCPKNWKVAVYILGAGGDWWIKPYFQTYATVDSTGRWVVSPVFTNEWDPLVCFSLRQCPTR